MDLVVLALAGLAAAGPGHVGSVHLAGHGVAALALGLVDALGLVTGHAVLAHAAW
jgi:hypothetical protein